MRLQDQMPEYGIGMQRGKPVPPRVEYANRVDVQRHEHDATLTFSRVSGDVRGRVATLMVPLALLDALEAVS